MTEVEIRVSGVDPVRAKALEEAVKVAQAMNGVQTAWPSGQSADMVLQMARTFEIYLRASDGHG